MSSGKYYALSGARSRMQMLDTITHNLANSKTPGFKTGQSVFEAVLGKAQGGGSGNQASLRGGFTDFSQGLLTPTGKPFDMAIEGEGFFRVADEQGNFLYTRQGAFNLDARGNLVGAGGLKLVDEKGLPIVVSGADATISEDGTLRDSDGSTSRIPLYVVDDPTALQRRGGAIFALNGGAATLDRNPKVIAGHVEESNVNVMHQMARMVEVTRAFEANQKAITNYSKLSAKDSEIGSLG